MISNCNRSIRDNISSDVFSRKISSKYVMTFAGMHTLQLSAYKYNINN